jgi:hypothetical protein
LSESSANQSVPLELLREYLKTAGTTDQPDGSVRHYHILITSVPTPSLYSSKEKPSFDLTPFFETFH